MRTLFFLWTLSSSLVFAGSELLFGSSTQDTEDGGLFNKADTDGIDEDVNEGVSAGRNEGNVDGISFFKVKVGADDCIIVVETDCCIDDWLDECSGYLRLLIGW